MKVWKKLNKGVLLTVIVLGVVVAYVVGLEMQRKNDKVEIQKAVDTYYSFVNKYQLLPEANRMNQNKISTSEYDAYLGEIENALKEIAVSNQEIVKAQMKVLKDNLDTEIASNAGVVSMDRKVLKVSNYAFDGDQVTINVECLLEKEMKNINDNTTRKTSDQTNDVLTFKKEDGKWKAVYASITNHNPYNVVSNTMGI